MALLLVCTLVFAFAAVRAKKLIPSALWLAGCSALLSIVFYSFGARSLAVIELSVGAGLVTVLFVLAINIAGDDPEVAARARLPRVLVAGLVLAFALLLGGYVLPGRAALLAASQSGPGLGVVLWQQRGLDVLVQAVLIFSGVLGLLGLLAESEPPLDGPAAREALARREYELQAQEVEISRREGGRP